MDRIKITTPENIEVEYTLADIGSRSAAVFIDSLIQAIGLIILVIIDVVIVRVFPELWKNSYGWIIGISLIIAAIILLAYYIIAEIRMNGRTPGKKLLKIRTVRNNGQPITLGHSIVRNLFKIFIDFLGIGAMLMFLNKEHKRLGDMVASTIVVIEDIKTKPITLESLQQIKGSYENYLSMEENDLLREYLERRDSLEDNSIVREEIKLYFTRKFQTMGHLEEWQEFIEKL